MTNEELTAALTEAHEIMQSLGELLVAHGGLEGDYTEDFIELGDRHSEWKAKHLQTNPARAEG